MQAVLNREECEKGDKQAENKVSLDHLHCFKKYNIRGIRKYVTILHAKKAIKFKLYLLQCCYG